MSVILMFSRSIPSDGCLLVVFCASYFSGAGEPQLEIFTSEPAPAVAAAELKSFLRDMPFINVTSAMLPPLSYK